MRWLSLTATVILLTAGLSARQQSGVPNELGVVTLTDGARSVRMKEIVPARRGHAGVVTSSQNFVFPGSGASIRSEGEPVFQFVIDSNVDDAAGIYLFRFDARSGRREIRVAKGPGGDLVEFSVARDHLIPTRLEELGAGRYRLRTVTPLRSGEYCLVVSGNYYDFGVN
jgi:hypothetical protein